MIEVYHGGTDIIESPNFASGRKNLDFGQGFYVTDLKEQAKRWADRVARQRLEDGIISIYDFDKEKAISEFRYLKFNSYDEDWLNFIVKCRTGFNPSEQYDCVEGGIANDRVIDTVEGYINGTIDASHALLELSKHQPNNQICFLGQAVIDNCLFYKDSEKLL